MTLENAKVLHKHYLDIGKEKHAAQLVERYPELAEGTTVQPDEPNKEVKKDGKRPKR